MRIFDASLSRSNTNPKKIYCIDHALVNSTSSGILRNTGHLLENLVFIALRRISAEIFYYRTKNGNEVDFIVQMSDRSRSLIQVCETLADVKTRKRETVALTEAMNEQGLDAGIIVSRNEEEQIVLDGKTIEVVPIWKFLLNLPEMNIPV